MTLWQRIFVKILIITSHLMKGCPCFMEFEVASPFSEKISTFLVNFSSLFDSIRSDVLKKWRAERERERL
jgi:hypothetical protein